MNNDAGISLLDDYLDGVSPAGDDTALALAIEEDPELLALLCDYASLEASLQEHLATPGEKWKGAPRVVSFWQRHRAGLCVAAGVAACLVLWIFAAEQPEPRKDKAGGSSGLIVRRFRKEDGRGVTLPSSPGVVVAGGKLVRQEFQNLPGELVQNLSWLSSTSVSTAGYYFSGIPPAESLRFPKPQSSQKKPIHAASAEVMFADLGDADKALAYGLRSAGVTFPDGASVRWITYGEKFSFEAVNTADNLARIAKMIGNPKEHGPRVLSLIPYLWRIPSGRQEVPVAVTAERVLTARETEEALKGHTFDGEDIVAAHADPGPPSESELRFYLRADTSPFDWAQETAGIADFKRLLVPVRTRQWRVGDVVFIAGLAGPAAWHSRSLKSASTATESAELEFELTLRDGESAVLHLGPKEDGMEWILMLRAGL
ncbi:MAG TPA: hypothetical protein VG796_10235 [Verrucomicrobiales bacterium]|nr:hypothetical protein [Verrucomicrobiales bacterium]